ncbi:MAG: LptF/LptG family permease, partial [Opitutales bacterium]|nr:LptF/LptG family permease [Opitutales bacterium]
HGAEGDAPAADHAYKTALKNLLRANPLRFIQPGSFVRDFPGYVIYANSSDGGELVGFRIWELDGAGRVKVAMQSDRAALSYDDDRDEIVLTLKDGGAERARPESPEDMKNLDSLAFGEFSVKLPLAEIIGAMDNGAKRLKRMTLGELLEARKSWHPRPEGQTTPELAFRDKIEVQLQIQNNFAMAFSIFSMVVLAVPLGIKASRTETFANLAMAVALAMSYYMMTVVISWLEKYPHMRPDILIWAPNLLFQAVGTILIWRSSKN